MDCLVASIALEGRRRHGVLRKNVHMDQANSSDDPRIVLEELLELCETSLATSTESAVLAVIHSWFVQTIDTVRAALTLHDAGLASTASPLVSPLSTREHKKSRRDDPAAS